MTKIIANGTNLDQPDIAQLQLVLRRLVLKSNILSVTVLILACWIVSNGHSGSREAIADDVKSNVASVVRARKIEVVNGNGNVVLELGSSYGNPHLMAMDESGVKRAALDFCRFASDDYGPRFVLFGPKEKAALELGCNKWGEPFISLSDKDDVLRAFLGIVNIKRPILEFFNDKREVLWRAPPA